MRILVIGKRIRKIISREEATKTLGALDPENQWFIQTVASQNAGSEEIGALYTHSLTGIEKGV